MTETGTAAAPAATATARGEPMIVLDDVSKWFGDFQALKAVDLTVGR